MTQSRPAKAFMSLLPNLLRSLLITGIFSFLAPSLLVGLIWGGIVLVGYIPALETASQVGNIQLIHVLNVFGSGSVIRGLFVIGLVCSSVGVLFDTYTFYRYQKINNS
ncbi:MAG: hypothetical protein SFY66_15010 [Oculatellaceae cyanobacterium bins.114]|nr:hypothetical protein [Oculatellaceae cyanobacterium bins.114]